MRILTTGAVMVAITALTVTACSSGKHTATPTGATSSPSNSSAVATTSPASTGSAPSKAQLSKMVLAASDFPSGWSATPAGPQSNDAQTRAAFAQCAGVPNSVSDQVAEVQSDDFAQGQSTVSSLVRSFGSAASVTSDLGAVTGPKATSCFQALLSAQVAHQVPAGSTVGDLSLTVTPVAGATQGLVARIAGHVTVTIAGQPITAYVDVAFIVGSHVEAQAAFEGVGAPVDAALEARLIQDMVTRVSAAG